MPDLPPIPTNTISAQRQQAPSAEGADVVSRAAVDFGRSVSRAAQDVAEIEMDVRNFQDRGHEAEVKHLMMQAEKEHLLFRQDNLDEASWQQDWQQRVKQVEQYASQFEMLPDNQQSMNRHVMMWADASELGVVTDIRTQSIQRSQQSQENLIYEYLANDRYDEADREIDNLQVLPEVKKSLHNKVNDQRRNFDKADAKVRYLTSPIELYESTVETILKDENFSEAEKKEMRWRMETRREQETSDQLRALGEEIPTRYQTTAQIDSVLEEMPWMDERLVERFRKSVEKSWGQVGAKERSILHRELDELSAYFFEVQSDPKLDREDYLRKRNTLEFVLLPYLQNNRLDGIRAKFGRTTWEAQQQRSDALSAAGKAGVTMDIKDKSEAFIGMLGDDMKKNPKRFVGRESEAKARFRNDVIPLIRDYPDATFKQILNLFEQKMLRGDTLKAPTLEDLPTREEAVKARADGVSGTSMIPVIAGEEWIEEDTILPPK